MSLLITRAEVEDLRAAQAITRRLLDRITEQVGVRDTLDSMLLSAATKAEDGLDYLVSNARIEARPRAARKETGQ